jgi:hypothetical protein
MSTRQVSLKPSKLCFLAASLQAHEAGGGPTGKIDKAAAWACVNSGEQRPDGSRVNNYKIGAAKLIGLQASVIAGQASISTSGTVHTSSVGRSHCTTTMC